MTAILIVSLCALLGNLAGSFCAAIRQRAAGDFPPRATVAVYAGDGVPF